MPSLWSIVPKDDGCHVVGKDHSLIDKASKQRLEQALWFIDAESADNYIFEHLDPEHYKSEDFWTLYLPCPYCGKSLRAMSQDDEIVLYHCEECLRDWGAQQSGEDIFRIQRKYWG